MSKRVGLEGFTVALDRILKKYGEDVSKSMETVVPRVASRGAKALREASELTFEGTGRYAKGWKPKTTKGRLRTSSVIYNANTPGLPHLLEHGHANWPEGRTTGRTHIAPIERRIEDWLEEEVKREL